MKLEPAIQEVVDNILLEIETAKIRIPDSEAGEYIDPCHWSRTGWAVRKANGSCTCRPCEPSESGKERGFTSLGSSKSRDRHAQYIQEHPKQRCLKCGLKLEQHTVKEFQYCEFVLAGSGSETLVMNRPD